MSIQELIKSVRSGIIHIQFINKEGKIINSGTGFISSGYLITNNHVYAAYLNDHKDEFALRKIRLSYQPDINFESLKILTEIEIESWLGSLKSGSDARNCDYAIIDVPLLKKQHLHQFNIAKPKCELGDKVLILGFPLEHENLVSEEASISSIYKKNDVAILQVNAGVNNGNSGGPLIDLKTGNVIGIITRKGTGLSSMFQEMNRYIDINIDFFKNALNNGVLVSIGNFNPIEFALYNQNQLKILFKEIEHSANVGIGYAFSGEYIVDALNQLLAKEILSVETGGAV